LDEGIEVGSLGRWEKFAKCEDEFKELVVGFGEVDDSLIYSKPTINNGFHYTFFMFLVDFGIPFDDSH
jgi:hypothetical protein